MKRLIRLRRAISANAALVVLLGALATVAACSSSNDAGSSDAAETAYSSCPQNYPMSCPSPEPSWSKDVQPIINSRCALGGQCHGVGGAERSMFDYTSYAGVLKNHLEMLTQVVRCAMPPAGAVPPTDAERDTLIAWFECGAPNN